DAAVRGHGEGVITVRVGVAVGFDLEVARGREDHESTRAAAATAAVEIAAGRCAAAAVATVGRHAALRTDADLAQRGHGEHTAARAAASALAILEEQRVDELTRSGLVTAAATAAAADQTQK